MFTLFPKYEIIWEYFNCCVMLTPQIPPHNIDKTELSLLLALVTEKTMFTALVDSGEEKQRQKWVFNVETWLRWVKDQD